MGVANKEFLKGRESIMNSTIRDILDKMSSLESSDKPLQETQTNEEQLLNNVKKSLVDYLSSIEEKYSDDSIRQRAADRDISAKPTVDRELVASGPALNVTASSKIAASRPVKTIPLEDGRLLEIHGSDIEGFELRHNGKSMPSKFKNLDHAQLALDMYLAQQKEKTNPSADYIEEK